MKLRRLGGLALAAALTTFVPVASTVAQTATQDTNKAGTETKNAAKDAGSATKKGTKKAYHKTKHGTKKVLHKITGKPDNAVTNPKN